MFVIRSGFDGLGLSVAVSKLVNEIEALRQTGRSWPWIADRLSEALGHPVSSGSACTVFSRAKKAQGIDTAKVEQAKRMLDEGLKNQPQIRIESLAGLPQPASPSARPKNSEIEEKTAAANAAGRPHEGAAPSGKSEPNKGATGEKTDYLPLGNSGSGWGDEVFGADKSK
jgi:hypothetical protein